jgi:hypothetical protein
MMHDRIQDCLVHAACIFLDLCAAYPCALASAKSFRVNSATEMTSALVLLVFWVVIVALASIANPCIAAAQLVAGNYGAAALFLALSIASWLVARLTWKDLKQSRGVNERTAEDRQ